MPIFEYRCSVCKATATCIRSVDRCKEDYVGPCKREGEIEGLVCKFKRILSPTPTTFRFNDFTGFKGLDKRRPGH